MSTNSERVERAAAEWLARQDLGNWGADDETTLELWLSASTANRVAFLRLAEAWRRAGELA
jgi:transmembrane sensor